MEFRIEENKNGYLSLGESLETLIAFHENELRKLYALRSKNDSIETFTKIKLLMREHHISQQDIGMLLGESQRTISRYLAGEIQLTSEQIQNMLNAVVTIANNKTAELKGLVAFINNHNISVEVLASRINMPLEVLNAKLRGLTPMTAMDYHVIRRVIGYDREKSNSIEACDVLKVVLGNMI